MAPRFQVNSVAVSYTQAKSLAAAVRAALEGFSGLMGGAGGVTVDYVFLDNESDSYEPVIENPAMRQDYIVWHQES